MEQKILEKGCMSARIPEPIEGYFLTTKENLIFDVKGLSHPEDRIIAFLRYYPIKQKEQAPSNYQKIYDLKKRYAYLDAHFPDYLFPDPRGRGLLQAVPKKFIKAVHNPIERMATLRKANHASLDALEKLALTLSAELERYVASSVIGISGSLLVSLQTGSSDIDLIVYGRENGCKVYQAMPTIFEQSSLISPYNQKELEALWIARGQTTQIDFPSFVELEQHKRLQGTIAGRDFYIRLVLFPDEYYEPYSKTHIFSLGEVELTAEVADASLAIFTPCVYFLTDVELLSSTRLVEALPDRLFSLRGRYCDLAKKGDRIAVRGKLERVELRRRKEYYQVVLGSTTNEFFRRQ